MEVFVLASGSKGNMTYLKIKDIKFFIDAGIRYQKIKNKMSNYQEDLTHVKTLFITHEHLDHIIGLKAILKQGFLEEIYLTRGTYQVLPEDLKAMFPKRVHFMESDLPFEFQGITIHPFSVSHDAKEPVGLVIMKDGKKLVHLTDTGYVDQAYHELLSNADIYLLEANHQPNKLMLSPRPFLLKKRILGESGHLSNDDAAWLMNKFVQKKPSIWIVTHISEDCNSVLDIEESIVKIFDDPTKVNVFFATQEGLPVIKI